MCTLQKIGLTFFIILNGFFALNLQQNYDDAVISYLDEQWSECIKRFENVVSLGKSYRTVVADCRMNCGTLLSESFKDEPISDLPFYKNLLAKTACLMKCKHDDLKYLDILRNYTKVLQNINSLKPYEYLHICYFKMNLLQKAASAAYTHYLGNPHDVIMKQNLDYYVQLPEVDGTKIVNFEMEIFGAFFLNGTTNYARGNWSDVIRDMEGALVEYLKTEKICRALCDGPFDQGWLPDFTLSVANHFTYCLNCKQKCTQLPKSIGFSSGIDFLSEVLNYLQICYYKMKNIKKACNAAASYLILKSEDEKMLENKNIYMSISNNETFIARPEIEQYFRRHQDENDILSYIETRFA